MYTRLKPYLRQGDADEDRRREYIRKTLHYLLSLGITAVQTNDARAWSIYRDLHHARGKDSTGATGGAPHGLPLRVYLTVPYDEVAEHSPSPDHMGETHDPSLYDQQRLMDAEGVPLPDDQIGLLSCHRVKLFADGSLGAETAALRKCYHGRPGHHGVLLETPEVNGRVEEEIDATI